MCSPCALQLVRSIRSSDATDEKIVAALQSAHVRSIINTPVTPIDGCNETAAALSWAILKRRSDVVVRALIHAHADPASATACRLPESGSRLFQVTPLYHATRLRTAESVVRVLLSAKADAGMELVNGFDVVVDLLNEPHHFHLDIVRKHYKVALVCVALALVLDVC